MRHIITGGSGFTGAVLVRQLLAQKSEVVVFDRRPPTASQLQEGVLYVQGDVTSPADLARLKLRHTDAIYHLAARQFADQVPPKGRDAWFQAVNVEGTRNVVAAMREAGTSRLVFFSTDMTYGLPTCNPVAPDHSQSPLGPYGRSKLSAEAILRGAEGLDATIFRPRLITGAGRLGVLGKLFRLIRSGLPVPMIGSGENRYQMVGVEDCARAAILAVNAGCPPGPFNLGSSSPPTTRELLSAIIRHAGTRSFLLPISGALLKPVLAMLDHLGAPLLYPEQFAIADLDVLLDTTTTREILGWVPERGDTQMMIAAYDAFIATRVSQKVG